MGLLQKFGVAKLPGGLDILDNWWIIGIAAGLYLVEFFADKIPYVDSVWDVVHTFIRVPAGAIVAYGAVYDLDPSVYVPATLIGGGLAFASHGTKAAARIGANLSPEPVSNWSLSIFEDIIAFAGVLLAVFLRSVSPYCLPFCHPVRLVLSKGLSSHKASNECHSRFLSW